MSSRRFYQNLLVRLLLCCIVIVTITGCKSKKSAEIISSELIQQEQGFGTDTAKYGEFSRTVVHSAERVYPISTAIMAEHEGLELDSIRVDAKDTVKEGDLLVSNKPITDELLTQKEAAIAKNKEEFENGKNNYEVKIQDVNNRKGTSSGIDLQILEVELRKLQRQYEWYIEDGEKVQQEMKENLEKLRNIQGDVNIYAPYDGVIDSVISIPSGTELTTSRELLTMHSEEQVLLYVKEGGTLRYQMQVEIQAGVGENKADYTGTVISANNIRTDAFKNGGAYIQINEPVDVANLKSITITAKEKELKNVLVVKEFAVSSEKEKDFVSIVDGKKAMKRHVISGGSSGDVIWILHGLSEGQTVSIQ